MVHINHTLGRIFLRAFRKRQLYRIENIGPTVVVTLLPGQLTPKLERANSRGVYIFHNLHFHWMSEHVINSVRYALEGHFVLYNSKYADTEAAKEHSDGLEVISALFVVRVLPNPNLWPLLNGVRHVMGLQQSINITMALDDILPAHISAYFRYPGSLTTPPCDEAVTWTLLYPPSFIGIQQLDLLRHLHRQLSGGAADWTRLDNTRPVQPLNRRGIHIFTTNRLVPQILGITH